MSDDSGYAEFIVNGCYDFWFINYFYAAFVGVIQNLIYPLNAYVIVFLTLSITAFVTITFIFIDKFNYKLATLFTLFINGFFAINHYSTISFTRMPTLLTVTGFLAILHYINKKRWKTGTIIGVLFVLIGSLIRFQIFEVSVVMVCVFVLGKSIVDYCSLNKSKRTLKDLSSLLFEKKRMIVAIITVALCFSLNVTADIMINCNKDLSYYKEYTSVRSKVWDYTIPDYEICKAEYDKIGVDDNCIQMVRNGYFDSNGGITLQKLNDIHLIQQSYNHNSISYLDTIKNMIVNEIGNIKAIGDKGIASLSFIIILTIFVLLMKKKTYFIPFLFIIPIFLFYSYLWLTNKSPFRAVYILWFSSVVYTCYSFSFSECREYVKSLMKRKKYVCYFLSFCIIALVSLGGLHLSNIANDYMGRFNYIENNNQDQIELQKYIEQNEDKKFELARSVSLPDKLDNIFYIYRTDINKNFQGFNCTYGELPYIKNQINAFGTDNLYSYLLEKNVFFVDNNINSHIKMIREYLNKYYGSGNEIITTEEKNIGDFIIYKFKEK